MTKENSQSSGIASTERADPGEPTVNLDKPQSELQKLKKTGGVAWSAFTRWASTYSGFNRPLDQSLKWARDCFSVSLFGLAAGRCVKTGHVAVLAAQVFSILFGLVSTVKYSDWMLTVQGIGYAALLVILQYTAEKFLGACNSLIDSSPSRLASKAFLDSFTLLTEVGGILALVAFCYSAHDAGNWSPVWMGLAFWAICDALAYVGLHPSMANVAVAPDVRAGEEAIGIMSFVVKAAVRVIPVAFGIGVVLGTLGLISGIFSVVNDRGPYTAHASLVVLIVSLSLPFAGYLFLTAYHLAMDVLGSILSIPERLDRIARK
jgi:hypothetical protein